jgi:hypothetical protein
MNDSLNWWLSLRRVPLPLKENTVDKQIKSFPFRWSKND